MGRLAKVLGVTGRGSVAIKLSSSVYYPGDVVSGEVRVKIEEPINADGVVVKFVGKYHMYWNEPAGKGPSNRHAKTVLDRKELALLKSPKTLEVGDHNFNFKIKLNDSMIGTSSIGRSCVGILRNVSIAVIYMVGVRIKTKGMLNSDIKDKKLVLIVSKYHDNWRPPHDIQPVQDHPLSVFCCFKRGLCRMNVSADKDIVNMLKDKVRVLVKIHNLSSDAITKIGIVLKQTWGVTVGPRCHSTTSLISVQGLSGCGPNASKEITTVIDMEQVCKDLPTSPSSKELSGDCFLVPDGVKGFKRLPLLPTTASVYTVLV